LREDLFLIPRFSRNESLFARLRVLGSAGILAGSHSRPLDDRPADMPPCLAPPGSSNAVSVGEDAMKLKPVAVLALLLSAAMLAFAADSTMTGYISDSHCGAKGAKAGHEQCAAKCVQEHGAKYVFVDDADHKVYAIDNQDKAADLAGHHVTVKGTVQGDNLKIASIDMAK
jgi:hypothetical protein